VDVVSEMAELLKPGLAMIQDHPRLIRIDLDYHKRAKPIVFVAPTGSPSSHTLKMQLLSCLAVALPLLILPATSVAIPSDTPHQLDESIILDHDSNNNPFHVAPPKAASTSASSSSTPLPLVIWHGLGDSFENDGLKSVANLVNLTVPGTYTYLIHIGEDGSADRQSTFFGNLTDQVALVCGTLASHPALNKSTAINALGFSQGGQFLRAYIERCNNPPVHNLVTFGSQHNGISQFQSCKTGDWVCLAAEALLKSGTWTSFVQNQLVPAQYFRDPEDLDNYLEHSNFLADVNNERPKKNALYKKNLANLNKFAMYMFEKDEAAIPKESGWFAEVNTTSGKVTKLQDRKIYKEDWLGLKELDEKGALDFNLVKNAGHMNLDKDVLVKAFKTYFAPVGKSEDKEFAQDEL
jgi:palmitoyl-protein thioesterase